MELFETNLECAKLFNGEVVMIGDNFEYKTHTDVLQHEIDLANDMINQIPKQDLIYVDLRNLEPLVGLNICAYIRPLALAGVEYANKLLPALQVIFDSSTISSDSEFTEDDIGNGYIVCRTSDLFCMYLVKTPVADIIEILQSCESIGRGC